MATEKPKNYLFTLIILQLNCFRYQYRLRLDILSYYSLMKKSVQFVIINRL